MVKLIVCFGDEVLAGDGRRINQVYLTVPPTAWPRIPVEGEFIFLGELDGMEVIGVDFLLDYEEQKWVGSTHVSVEYTLSEEPLRDIDFFLQRGFTRTT